jgi:hypothetical protein
VVHQPTTQRNENTITECVRIGAPQANVVIINLQNEDKKE